jgi:hypothetical protein
MASSAQNTYVCTGIFSPKVVKNRQFSAKNGRNRQTLISGLTTVFQMHFSVVVDDMSALGAVTPHRRFRLSPFGRKM